VLLEGAREDVNALLRPVCAARLDKRVRAVRRREELVSIAAVEAAFVEEEEDDEEDDKSK